MRLFIAEKPSVGKALAARLGVARATREYIECKSGDTVTWCFGHLFGLANPDHYDEKYKQWRMPDLPIVPEKWVLLPKAEAKGQIAAIKALLKRATVVVNGGDPDDEGELLVYEVLESLGWTGPVKRLWLRAMDDASVDAALGNLRDGAETYGMKMAAECRSRADWLLGLNLTRACTITAQSQGGEGVVSVGRVQTPTLALVVNRDLSIEKFKPSDYFEVRGEFSTTAGRIAASWVSPAEGAGIDPEGRVIDRAIADAAAAKVRGQSGVVVKCEKKAHTRAAPLPFSLSALQSEASSRFGMSAKRVLDICQALYETHKLTTYPRTDCQYLPVSMHADAKQVLSAIIKSYQGLASLVRAGDAAVKHAAFNDAKITAHHAIIPTTTPGNTNGLKPDEMQIYDLITRRYLAMFYPDHEYLQTAVEFEVAGELFRASGRQVTEPGWQRVVVTADAADAVPVPAPAKGSAITCTVAESVAKQTKPSARFSEGTLIAAMSNIHQYVTHPEVKKSLKESAGIGTEATRAGIIETLKKREFLTVRGKQIISTPKARALITALPSMLTAPDLTAAYEQRLTEIRENRGDAAEFVAKQVTLVNRVLEILKGGLTVAAEPTYKCPRCGKGLRRLKGKNGYFWGCTGYSEGCRYSASDEKGKPAGTSDPKPADTKKPGTRKTTAK